MPGASRREILADRLLQEARIRGDQRRYGRGRERRTSDGARQLRLQRGADRRLQATIRRADSGSADLRSDRARRSLCGSDACRDRRRRRLRLLCPIDRRDPHSGAPPLHRNGHHDTGGRLLFDFVSRAGALCRKLDYAAWPSSAAVASAVGHAAVRHNQSVSRKASSSSLGR